tara:strand:- start:6048 stop:7190 length:1143 start_codon:yes stop_codon:yes gene_type:complete
MFDNRAIAELKKVVGWRDHWDITEIPALSAALTTTESGQYYQDYHPSVRLDYIQALLPSNYPLATFLDDIESSAINQMLEKMITQKKLNNAGMDLARNDLIYDNILKDRPIINESRFVGVEFSLNSDSIGLRAVIHRIGLYLTVAQPSMNLYLYNSLQPKEVAKYSYTSAVSDCFTWLAQQVTIDYSDGSDNSGAVWYLGYYQDDLVGQAVLYDSLNWKNGYCRTCGGGDRSTKYNSISRYITMSPFYVEGVNLPAVGTMFDTDDMVKTPSTNYGFNFNISIVCNLTQFWIDNRSTMTNAIGKIVALKVLEMMKASSQVSAIEQNVQINIIRDLEGDSDTRQVPFWAQVERAVKTTNLDQANVNSTCVPCARKGAIYGAV